MSTRSLSYLLDGLCEFDAARDREVNGLDLDSRGIRHDELFLACAGIQKHGLLYAEQAVARGAAAIVYEDDAQSRGDAELKTRLADLREHGLPVIGVPELGRKAGVIAERFYDHPSRELFVIGVTGTNGKTSCAHFIAQALSSEALRGEAAASGLIGTLGYGLYGDLRDASHTTPDAVTLHGLLADMRVRGARFAVMEVSSHGMQQGRVSGVEFDLAVFTNLSRDHLDYHGDMQSYGAAKRKLFETPGLRFAVVNRDDEFGRELLKTIPEQTQRLAYSLEKETDSDTREGYLGCVRGSELVLNESGMAMHVSTPWGEGSLHAPLLGRFNASNVLAVLASLLLAGVKLEAALKALAELHTVPGRMQCFGGGPQPLVVVDYAHTPDALDKALRALREHCAGRLWVVFGCGGDRDQGKRPQMGAIAETLADRVVVTDDNPRSEAGQNIIDDILTGMRDAGNANVEHDRARAIALAVNGAAADDVVLVAGKGHEDYQLLGNQVLSFSDIETVSNLLEVKH